MTDLDPTATSLLLGQATFNTSPPAVQGVTMGPCGGTFATDHQNLAGGDSVTIQFILDQKTFAKTPTGRVAGLVSRSDSSNGFAPVTLTINGHVLAQSIVVSPAGWAPESASFEMPPAYLMPGVNTLVLTVDANATEYFWLYQLAVDLTSGPYVGPSLGANLQVSPVALDPGLTLVSNSGSLSGDHSVFWGGGVFSVSFTLTDANARNDEVRVRVFGLVSQAPGGGFAPISVMFNGQALVIDFTMPGGGWTPNWVEFLIPAEMCVAGTNTVALTVSGSAQTAFWLYRVVVQKSEFYQSLGLADFSVSPATASNLTITQNDGTFASDHLNLASGNTVTVSFNAPLEGLLVMEFDALVAQSNGPGYGPVTLSINGAPFVANYTVLGGGWAYSETAFLIPPQLVVVGANQISLQVVNGATTYFWLRALRIRSLINGPAVRREMATAAPCYRSLNQIGSVPLLWVAARASSALGVVSGIATLAGSGVLAQAVTTLNAAADDLTWVQNAVTAALAGGPLTMAGVTITPNTPQATGLNAFLTYAIGRCQQESQRLGCIQQNAPLNFTYTYGCNVTAAVAARLAQVTAVVASGSTFQFTDQSTNSSYSFATAALAAQKRTVYCLALQAEIVSQALADAEAAAQQVLALATQQASGQAKLEVGLLAGFLVAVIAVSIYSVLQGFVQTAQSTTAANGGNYPMNWNGWLTDWADMINYNWQSIPGIGYLKPGDVYSVYTPEGRVDQSLAGTVMFGAYYNYVYISASDHPIRLSPKNPSVSPPGEIMHSQLAGGLNVDCAGEIQFADGKFRHINANSGHYYKNGDWNACMAQFKTALAAMGYDTSGVTTGQYFGPDLEDLYPVVPPTERRPAEAL